MNNVGTADYHYLHTDHLGTVQMATDSGGQISWKGQAQAFGKTELDPANRITMNLRLPGQYFDSETRTHYNWMRDYNGSTGGCFPDGVNISAAFLTDWTVCSPLVLTLALVVVFGRILPDAVR